MLESKFQANLVAELKRRFPGCIVMKNDANYIQGIPDILILYHDTWASLECKKSASAKKQPNQEYYVRRMNEMSFSTSTNIPNLKGSTLFLEPVNITGLITMKKK